VPREVVRRTNFEPSRSSSGRHLHNIAGHCFTLLFEVVKGAVSSQGETWRALVPEGRGGVRGATAPKNFSGLFLKVLHRPLTAPLVAKLAPPVSLPQMKISG